MKNILVTGGAGFVGSNLAIKFKTLHPDWRIYALDNLRRRGSELNIPRLKASGVEFIHGDIRNREDIDNLLPVDVIIDASADPSVLAGINSPVYPLIQSNLLGTANLLEFAAIHKSDFVFLSTSRIYPVAPLEDAKFEELDTRFRWTNNQLLRGISQKGIAEDFPLEGSRSFYGASKLASELLIQEYTALKGIRTVINRCGVISGPWQMGKVDQGVLVLWVARHVFKKPLSYIGYGGTGKQMRDVIHIDDLFDLVNWQLENLDKVNGNTYNVGGGEDVSFSLQELTAICQKVTGNTIEIKPVTENRAADIRIYVSDCSKIQALSGWKPKRNMETLVKDIYEWIKNNETALKTILE